MIPPYCPADAPPGEKQVYAELQASDLTEDWIVLHSLGIADHVRQVEGETDFVVIVPNVGILVIEVKSHKSVDRLPNGTWRLGNNPPTARGPFQQANEAKHSLRGYLGKQQVDLHSVPMISSVWFTGVRARSLLPTNPEWHHWQVLDSEDLRAAPAAVLRTLRGGTDHLGEKIRRFAHGGVGPDTALAQRIAHLLRPRFEIATFPGDRRRARQAQLVSFIEEQFLGLDAVAGNRSVLFSGPAGSGKTFLAMEAARRELAAGKRGRLLCFNRFLGNRLKADMSAEEGLIVGTLHQELLRLAGLDRAPSAASPEFWNTELPDRALEALVADDAEEAKDFLIVDEIQDVATGPYLDVLDLMVKGGLKEGRVLVFGDFERQAIFENEDGGEVLRQRMPHAAAYNLVHNCRNLPRIGYQVNLLSHLQPGYQKFRRQDDGIDPILHRYRAGEDQSALLASAIRELKGEGYELNEIVVLSPRGEGSTAATTTDPWLRQILKQADGLPARPGQVHFSTVHAFKGLESPAVVVTDLEVDVGADNFESLLYVGLTRATDRLIALVEEEALRGALGGRR